MLLIFSKRSFVARVWRIAKVLPNANRNIVREFVRLHAAPRCSEAEYLIDHGSPSTLYCG